MIKFVQNLAIRETKTFSGYMNTKEFVKWVLAVLCGLFIWGIVKFFMFFMMLGSMIASAASFSGGSGAVIPKEGVLLMDMSKFEITEQTQESNPLTSIQGREIALVGLHDAVKAVIAYGEAFTSGSYYLASVADKIYTTRHHGGNNFMLGISGRMLFLKD